MRHEFLQCQDHLKQKLQQKFHTKGDEVYIEPFQLLYENRIKLPSGAQKHIHKMNTVESNVYNKQDCTDVNI